MHQMFKSKKKSKLYYILSSFSFIFCIYEKPKNKNLYTIYYMLFWIAFGIFQIFGMERRINSELTNMLSILTIELFFRAITFLTNLVASLDMLFFNTDKYEEIGQTLKTIENFTGSSQNEITRCKYRFLVVCATKFLFTVSCVTFNFVVNIKVLQTSTFIMFIPLFMVVIQASLLIVNICSKLYNIGTCIRFLNKEMHHTLMYSYSWVIIEKAGIRSQQLKRFMKKYEEIFDVMDLVNKVYNFHFLMLLLTVTLMMLHISNLLVKYVADVASWGGGSWKIASMIFLILDYISFGVLITYTCDNIVKQVKETINVAYQLLIHLSGESKTEEEQDIKDNLLLLTEQIHGRNFHFTAGGLFIVDFTALFMIMGSIAMYIIIIPIDL